MYGKMVSAFAAALFVSQLAFAPAAHALKFPENGFQGLHNLEKDQPSKKTKKQQPAKPFFGKVTEKKKRN